MTPRPMIVPARALALAALLAVSATAPAAGASDRGSHTSTLPVDSVRAGMVGVGYTVFEGTRIDTFSVSIVGVLRAYRPGGSLIMARASNPYLDKTGIIAGMSGSPIYVNGRLIGALSYTWGFLKEPLAGITPIEEMLDVLPGPEGIPASVQEDRIGLGPESGPAPSPGGGAAGAGGGDGALADGMRPIGAPVMLSGFTSDAIRF